MRSLSALACQLLAWSRAALILPEEEKDERTIGIRNISKIVGILCLPFTIMLRLSVPLIDAEGWNKWVVSISPVGATITFLLACDALFMGPTYFPAIAIATTKNRSPDQSQ